MRFSDNVEGKINSFLGRVRKTPLLLFFNILVLIFVFCCCTAPIPTPEVAVSTPTSKISETVATPEPTQTPTPTPAPLPEPTPDPIFAFREELYAFLNSPIPNHSKLPKNLEGGVIIVNACDFDENGEYSSFQDTIGKINPEGIPKYAKNLGEADYVITILPITYPGAKYKNGTAGFRVETVVRVYNVAGKFSHRPVTVANSRPPKTNDTDVNLYGKFEIEVAEVFIKSLFSEK